MSTSMYVVGNGDFSKTYFDTIYQVTSENNLTIKGVAVVPLNSRADVFFIIDIFH